MCIYMYYITCYIPVMNIHVHIYVIKSTLRVDHDAESEHNPLGEECRVTLIPGVQGKPHLRLIFMRLHTAQTWHVCIYL